MGPPDVESLVFIAFMLDEQIGDGGHPFLSGAGQAEGLGKVDRRHRVVHAHPGAYSLYCIDTVSMSAFSPACFCANSISNSAISTFLQVNEKWTCVNTDHFSRFADVIDSDQHHNLRAKI